MEKENIDKIKQLHVEGKKVTEIAKELNVNKCTIYYYLDEDFRKKKLSQSVSWFKKLPLERRQQYYKKRLPYMTKYQKKRYNSDPVFKNKQKERMKKLKSKKEELTKVNWKVVYGESYTDSVQMMTLLLENIEGGSK